MRLRLGKILLDRGIKQRWLADELDTSPGYISNLISGKKLPSPKMLARIAEVLGVPSSMIISDSGAVAVAGKVGAGAAVDLIDAYEKGGGLFHVAAPDDLPPSGIVAVEVEGDSMLPMIEPGDIIFFTRHFYGVDPAVINSVGICQTEDGRALIKQIRQGREPDIFDLHSVNPATPVEYGVRLLWAAPWRRMLRKQDVEIVEP